MLSVLPRENGKARRISAGTPPRLAAGGVSREAEEKEGGGGDPPASSFLPCLQFTLH